MPFLLVLTTFVVLLLIGCGVVAVMRLPLSRRTVLGAPSIGLATLTTIAMTLGALGVHTNRFAWPLVLLLTLLGCVCVARARTTFLRAVPWAQLAFVVLAGLILATPTFRYGFAWVGFANEDITRTAMNAQWWQDHGTYARPQPVELVWNREIDGSEIGHFAPLQGGTAELLAIFQVVTRLGPFEPMMPFVLVAYMCALAAFGAMMPRRIGVRWNVVAMACLAVSPLFVYTAINQAADELFGLALMCSYIAVLPALWRRSASPRWYLLAGVLFSGLYELYLPLLIFVVLLTCLHALLTVKFERGAWARIARRGALGALLGALLLNAYLLFLKITVIAMFASGSGPLRSVRFTAFLVPPGIAYLWGLIPLWGYPADPWMSLGILAGTGLTIAFAVFAIRQARRRRAAALLGVMGLAFSAFFFVRRADYALFKMASYFAPLFVYVMIGAAASFLAARRAGVVRRTILRAAIVTVFAISVVTSAFYVRRSLDAPGDTNPTFVNGRFLTSEHIVERIRRAVHESSAPVLVSNATLQNIQRFIVDADRRKTVFFVSSNDVENAQPSLHPEYVRWRPVAALRLGTDRRAPVALFAVENRPFAPAMRAREQQYLMVGPQYSVFNRTAAWNVDPFFSIVAQRDMTNGLALVDSSVGSSQPGDPHVAISVLEQDYFAAARTYAGVGRYLVFEVLRPTANIRLLLDFTTVGVESALRLPPVAVIGRTRYPFPLVGRGSARVLSPSITPAFFHGHAYIALDMGREGIVRKIPRHGLFALFGREFDLDERRLVANVRDLTVVAGASAATVESLRSIPGDLRSTGVRYSGIYDDGWLSQDSTVELSASAAGKRLRIAGVVPHIGDWPANPAVTVKIDDRTVWSGFVPEGTFDIAPNAAIARGPHRVHIHFDQVQQLPGGDDRPVGALLQRMGLY